MKKLFLLLCVAFYSATTFAASSLSIDANHLTMTILSFFGIGVLLAFTPCVLPMIPILSGILVGQKELSSRRALKIASIFVLGMALTYAVAGLLAGYVGSTLQTVLQVPWIIVAFSLVFVAMSLSMFGLYELRLPNKYLNRMHTVSGKLTATTSISVLLMGILSTLISSPCVTAPLITILTYIGEQGNALFGGILLFVLALGMGLPLILFAIGQGSILPKTGPWMITIKHLFGVMMLALAIWMLSRILPSNVTMLLTAILVIISAIVFGAFDFQHHQRLVQAFSFFALLYGVLLLVGAASGHEDFIHPLQSNRKIAANINVKPVPQLFTYVSNEAQLQNQLTKAKRIQKPVLIEFYAAWCPVCRALDANAFADEKLQRLLQAFVVLRVDITNDNDELVKLRERYHVYGVPTIVFYDKTGKALQSDPKQELTKDFLEQKLIELG